MTQLSKIDARIINIDIDFHDNVLHDEFKCSIRSYDVYVHILFDINSVAKFHEFDC